VISDWKQAIARCWLVKQEMMQLDHQKLYEYSLPRVAATEQEISYAEHCLGLPLDPRYRAFLLHANGWKGFLQQTDLFGTTELVGGPEHEAAQFTLSMLDEAALSKSRANRKELLPIAVSKVDRDLSAITVSGSACPGRVVWYGGEQIDQFPTFDDYFLAMIDYNTLELQRFNSEQQNTGL
jgi:SMI1/KNR4 family protein SUKH-1